MKTLKEHLEGHFKRMSVEEKAKAARRKKIEEQLARQRLKREMANKKEEELEGDEEDDEDDESDEEEDETDEDEEDETDEEGSE